MGAEHARVPGPAGDGQDQGDAEGAGGEVGREDDGERQAGDDQEHVEEQRQQGVDAAAEVAGSDADQRAEGDDQQADGEADREREAGAEDGLGEDVLALAGGAEPVGSGRRLAGHAEVGGGRRDEQRADEADEDQGREEAGAEGGFGIAAQGAQRGGDGGVHLHASLARGSSQVVTTSTRKLAPSTESVMARKMPCISG